MQGIVFLSNTANGTIYLDEMKFTNAVSTNTRFMDFPLRGFGPHTAPLTAVIDHSMSTGPNCNDGQVVAYTNERGLQNYGTSSWSTSTSICSNTSLYGYANGSRTSFTISGQYVTDVGNEYGKFLFYDGHFGHDFPVPNGTAVYPVHAGTISRSGDGLKIAHPNGYTSYYLHLSSILVSQGWVTTGTIIGKTGSGHLHLTVMRDLNAPTPMVGKGHAAAIP